MKKFIHVVVLIQYLINNINSILKIANGLKKQKRKEFKIFMINHILKLVIAKDRMKTFILVDVK